jgi:hypothetical protein
MKFERSRRYRDCYRCQEKKSRRGRARDLVFRDPPTPRTRDRSLFVVRDSPPLLWAYMMVDVWDCSLYWWIFALWSCLPATIGKTSGIFFSILKGKLNKFPFFKLFGKIS